MNVGEIKEQIAYYLQQSVASFSSGGTDFLLVELNRSRRKAERLHDFVYSEALGYLSIDPDDGGLLTAVKPNEDLTGTALDVKTVQTFYLQTTTANGYRYVPMLHHSRRRLSNEAKELFNKRTWGFNTRYPASDEDAYPSLSKRPAVEWFGKTIKIVPAPSEAKVLGLDCYTWLPDYTDDADEDFITENGADYLIWETIVKLNYRIQTFVPRQDKVLPPPDKLADDAYADLVEWDGYLVEEGRTPRLR